MHFNDYEKIVMRKISPTGKGLYDTSENIL